MLTSAKRDNPFLTGKKKNPQYILHEFKNGIHDFNY